VTAHMRERAAAMVRRVGVEAAARLGEQDAVCVRAAVALALAYRDARIDDDHDSRCLHPARTVLILLADTTLRSPAALAAAAFVDSVDNALVPAAAELERVAGSNAAALLADVPAHVADPEALLERVISADENAALVALAERLDHARHLHLRPDLDWQTFHQGIRDVYVPSAGRLSPPLQRRLDRWAEAFGRRLLYRP
jgi:(p)ppGpp synthase/HD superfamily hydrolase